MDSLDQNINLGKKELVVSKDARYNFEVSGKWAKFLAIMGFIFTGFIVIAGLVMLGTAASMPSYLSGQFFGMGVVYLIMGGVMIFPALYMIRFAISVQKGLESDDQSEFDTAVQNLKSLFKFLGIYTIVVVGIYIIAFLIGIAAAAGGGRF